MVVYRRAKIVAFKSRLEAREAERRRIVELVTKSQVNLARVAERIDSIQSDIRVLSKELKLLEMSDPEE